MSAQTPGWTVSDYLRSFVRLLPEACLRLAGIGVISMVGFVVGEIVAPPPLAKWIGILATVAAVAWLGTPHKRTA